MPVVTSLYLGGGDGRTVAAAVGRPGRGRLAVRKVCAEELPPGCLQAGAVCSPDALGEALRQFYRRNRLPRRTALLLPDAPPDCRTLSLPRLPGRETRRIVTRELNLAGAGEAPLDDYMVLHRGREADLLLACRVERARLAPYADAARLAGLRLCRMDLAPAACIKLASATPAVAGRDWVMAIQTGGALTLLRFEGGLYCRMARCFPNEKHGADALLRALADLALGSDLAAVKIYLCGFAPSRAAALVAALAALGLWAAALPGAPGLRLPRDAPSNVFDLAVGNLLTGVSTGVSTGVPAGMFRRAPAGVKGDPE